MGVRDKGETDKEEAVLLLLQCVAVCCSVLQYVAVCCRGGVAGVVGTCEACKGGCDDVDACHC